MTDKELCEKLRIVRGTQFTPYENDLVTEAANRIEALTTRSQPGEDAVFARGLRSVLADCSGYLADKNMALADRCEAMLSQVVAEQHECAALNAAALPVDGNG